MLFRCLTKYRGGNAQVTHEENSQEWYEVLQNANDGHARRFLEQLSDRLVELLVLASGLQRIQVVVKSFALVRYLGNP